MQTDLDYRTNRRLLPTNDLNRASKVVTVQGALYRQLFLLSVLWGALVFWVAPHPPMIDLPQHAGQVTLLKEMLLGQSPWMDQFRFNFLTPYVIGYGLALPLSFIMPVSAALKVLLSVAYLAFVAMCVKLRQQFEGDARLDWFFVLSFLGFAYTWGFLTFLVAAPIGLWFILLSERYAQRHTTGLGLAVIGVGILMLASHGLVFGFAWVVGAGMLTVRLRRLRPLMARVWPYIVLAVVCAVYFGINRKVNAGLQSGLEQGLRWEWNLFRFDTLLYTVAAGTQKTSSAPFWLIVFFMAALPWLMGLRIDWRNKPSWVPFVAVMLILVVVPHFAMNTSFLYERFSLFLAPAYAWMFSTNTATATRQYQRSGLTSHLFAPLLVIMCWAMLGVHTERAWHFKKETAELDALMKALEPGQRALSLVFDRDSDAANTYYVYLHYPLWYQAERSGLVDFNFAWFPPQIVRFRPEHAPAVSTGFEWRPQNFDWVRHHGDTYRYFFVRHNGVVPAGLFTGAACAPIPAAAMDRWTVFERRECKEQKRQTPP